MGWFQKVVRDVLTIPKEIGEGVADAFEVYVDPAEAKRKRIERERRK